MQIFMVFCLAGFLHFGYFDIYIELQKLKAMKFGQLSFDHHIKLLYFPWNKTVSQPTVFHINPRCCPLCSPVQK